MRFLSAYSTPIGGLSTTVDITHQTINGGMITGVTFDGNACPGCNFHSPEIETAIQAAWNIGRGNTVDFYSPYVENVPASDSAYGIFRIGQDFATATGYPTYVNIHGGEVGGTDSTATLNYAFDLGSNADRVSVYGTQFNRIGTFETNTGGCSLCAWNFNNVRADLYAGFGAVSNPSNVNMGSGNRFNSNTRGGAAAYPVASAQPGTMANAPAFYNSPGQHSMSSDYGPLFRSGASCTGVTLNIVASGGAITSGAVASGGSGCLTGNSITVNQAGGALGTFTVTVSGGVVTAVALSYGGSGYATASAVPS
jgi:hypothetical protein